MFGERLKECRRSKGMTQAELGEALGVAQTTIAGWESGLRSPGVDAIVRIAGYFGCTSDYLLGISDKKGKNDRDVCAKIASAKRINKLLSDLSSDMLDSLGRILDDM